MSYCTDNAAMIAIAGALKWADGYTPVLSVPPDPRLPF
jgi:tRNA A37 threonylcarbamoyltransferase TsaD